MPLRSYFFPVFDAVAKYKEFAINVKRYIQVIALEMRLFSRSVTFSLKVYPVRARKSNFCKMDWDVAIL